MGLIIPTVTKKNVCPISVRLLPEVIGQTYLQTVSETVTPTN